MSTVRATYRIVGTPEIAAERARAIAFEQTVELPAALVCDPAVLGGVVGRVIDLTPCEARPDAHDAVLEFDAELACGQLSQLLNLVFGNVSLWGGVRLVDLRLPDALSDSLPGPAHGIDGLRALLGVGGRPLLATAIKPRGASLQKLAAVAGDFARGGGDIVKDDQNLNDTRFEDWYERVSRCADAVHSANAQRQGRCLYMPHVAGPADEMQRRVEAAARLGLRGVLLAPSLVGLDYVSALTRRHGMVVLAHPAASGGALIGRDHGMEPAILLGTLFRLAGADASIFPNFNGRFNFLREQCLEIATALRAPLAGHRAAAPCPAGGMDFDRLAEMIGDYGSDAVLLVGGALLGAVPDLAAATARYLDRIREHCEETAVEAGQFASACELSDVPRPNGGAAAHLRFAGDFEWEGRPSLRYKANGALPFHGVRRVELVGQHGEDTAFDLRYFEVEPGGFTSLERHAHTHAIVAARGRGVLVRDSERTELNTMDVAYVAPHEVHQLRNETTEPFGFFCIVDHERDRPQRP
jgi:ribulose-bisphosphate carboxylase large chain